MRKMLHVIPTLVVVFVLAACTFPTWSTYTNTAYSFRLQYPPGGSIVPGATDTSIRIQLPITPGTNLVEKYLEISVQTSVPTCESPLAAGYSPALTPTTLTINGLTWDRENASEGAAGSFFDWTAYSTVNGSVCVNLTFVLHSHNPGVYVTPPPTFNHPAESLVFILIVDTFTWLGGAVTTPTPGVAAAGIGSTATPAPTVTPVPTLTPTPVPTDTPTNTPASFVLLFTPRVSPPGFNYQANQRGCKTTIPQVDISVAVSDPAQVHDVVLFLRLKSQASGAETPWNQGLVMNMQGNGIYDKAISANDLPNLTDISNGGASAWLEYQFVATGAQGNNIGRSQVYSDVSLTPCK